MIKKTKDMIKWLLILEEIMKDKLRRLDRSNKVKANNVKVNKVAQMSLHLYSQVNIVIS